MKASDKVTIRKIAELAGVSTATVDRVLNERPGVAQRTRDKVLEVASGIAYSPNVLHRMAMGSDVGAPKGSVIDFVWPDSRSAFFEVFSKALKEEAVYFPHISFRVHMHKTFDADELSTALLSVPDDSSAICFVGFENPQVSLAIAKLQERSTPLVSIMCGATYGNTVPYLGINDRASGRTAGQLLHMTATDLPGKVLVIRDGALYQGQSERDSGLRNFLVENCPDLDPLPSLRTQTDLEETARELKQILADNQDIRGIYICCSGASILAKTINETRFEDKPVVICHDMTDDRIEWMVKGTIDFILHQDPHLEAINLLRAIDKSLQGEKLDQSMLSARTNIITRENLFGN